MTLITWILKRAWSLPPATHSVSITKAIRIPVRDGVDLFADRYYPRLATQAPTVLIRTCYGRGTLFAVVARLFAERGLQVLIQSCRGTCGSQGTFRPFFDEQNDGEDTVYWIEKQPWFAGQLALWGISYLGNAAWAIGGSKAASKVGALGLHVTLTNFRDRTYAFDGFTVLGCIGWTAMMSNIIRTGAMLSLSSLLGRRKTEALAAEAVNTVPLRQADRRFETGGILWWQEWMDHAEPGDPWWDAIDYGNAASSLPPTVMTAGWYDIFLPWQLRDFEIAQRAGRDVRITIGPWTHAATAGIAESMRQSITLFQETLGNSSPGSTNQKNSPRVRLMLMGANEWRDYPSWPPPNTSPRTYYLQAGGGMTTSAPSLESESSFDYDPATPTPSLHGPTLESPNGSGSMAELERRPDVLIYSTEPLLSDIDAIGQVSGQIFLRSDTAYTDVYLCLCDVTGDGVSTNVCDGYRRLRPDPAAGVDRADHRVTRHVSVEFWPTAYRFRRGHRIRIIVASGAHPRYARNPGGGEPLGDAATMVVAHQHILHGPAHPSTITLAVLRG